MSKEKDQWDFVLKKKDHWDFVFASFNSTSFKYLIEFLNIYLDFELSYIFQTW